MTSFVLVGIGGLVGSLLRFGLGLSLKSVDIFNVPIATMLINIVGSFLIGCVLAIGQDRLGNLFYFLVPGLLGGFTTYSAFSGETMMMLKNQLYQEAMVYVTVTVIGGLISSFLAYYIMKQLPNLP